MRYPAPATRPGVATFFGLVSLIWALTTLGGTLVMLLVVFVLGAASWLIGPFGAVLGSALAGLVALYLVASSALSFLLLSAGWLTLQGDPRGVARLRLWAWISLALDVVALLFTVGHAPNGYVGIGYAIAVLYFTTPRVIEERWVPGPGQRPWAGKAKYDPDPDF